MSFRSSTSAKPGQKAILITHTDLDGLGSAILAIKEKLFDEIYCWNNNYEDMSIIKGNNVVIADLALSQNAIKNALVYDHHEASKNIKNGKYDPNRCGTKLFYELYMKKPMHNSTRDKFVHLVDIYDRWQDMHEDFNDALNLGRVFNKTVWKRPNALIYTKSKGILKTNYSVFISEMLKVLDQAAFKLSPVLQQKAHEALMEENEAYEDAISDAQTRTDARGNKFTIMCMSKFITENGNRYLREHEDVVYILSLGSEYISARCREGFNLTQLEGLKGHPRASAGPFSPDFIEDLWDDVVHELNYRV